MNRIQMILAALMLLVTQYASAECACMCVSGEVQAICQSSIDLKPICAPRICPIVPPSIPPILTPSIPPIGTNQCRNEQVYNSTTGRYEWKQICR